MSQKYAPLAIFCYKRLKLTKRLLTSLEKNEVSKNSQAYFFVDYPKYQKDKKHVKNVIKEINKTKIFKKKKIILRKSNFGIKRNVIDGVNLIFKKFNKIIVLEDDLEVSDQYLKAINNLLNIHINSKKIFTITGYSIPDNYLNKKLIKKDFYLCKRPSSWGWATWKKKWKILEKIKDQKIIKSSYGNDLVLMQKKNFQNELDSWAFQWTNKHINNEKYCIYPKYSLVKNNGDDEYSTNNFLKLKKFKNFIRKYKFNNFKEYEFENEKIKISFRNLYNNNIIYFFIKLIYYETKKIIKLFQ